MKRLFGAALFGFVIAGATSAQPAEISPIETRMLTREEALSRALDDDPGIAAVAQSVRSAEASARQAGLRPNPTLDLQLEDFGGTGPFDGASRAEATYSLNQKFELGGDRQARLAFANRQTDAARIRAGLSALDLTEAVEVAFVEAQAAQAIAYVARSRLVVAKDFSTAVERRVQAARDPQAAQSRVAARLAETEIEVATAEARVSATQAALASYWGGISDFSVETETFFEPLLRAAGGAQSPDLALSEAARDSAAARVEIERAKRVPDPTVRVGFRQFQEANNSAFIIGISIPLPIWNSNSGALAAVLADKSRAEFEVEARARAIAREVAFLSSQATSERAEIEAYAARVIPSSEKALALSLRAYRQGGISYLEVLDAQASLTEARLRQISTLLSYHRAEVKLARRSGVLLPANLQENLQ